MVVDDNPGVLEFVASILEMTKRAEVSRFHCATEALEAFKAAPEKFQFVVTDFEMPGLNGIELGRRLLAASPCARILLVTGSTAITEAEARRWGFCGMLPKPFSATALWQAAETAGVSTSRENNFSKHEAASLAA